MKQIKNFINKNLPDTGPRPTNFRTLIRRRHLLKSRHAFPAHSHSNIISLYRLEF